MYIVYFYYYSYAKAFPPPPLPSQTTLSTRVCPIFKYNFSVQNTEI